jgi:3-hydroxyacyl-[acyl-carrier-protein] dehydratase
MQSDEIMKLLHHRSPYLMVSEVPEITPEYIHAVKNFTGDEYFLKGHFPGASVVPGAMLQEFCTQSAGILMTKYHSPVDNYDSEKTKGWAIGVLNKVERAKYLDIVKPNTPISCKVELIENLSGLYKFKARVFQGEKLKAKLNFNLVITSDDILY